SESEVSRLLAGGWGCQAFQNLGSVIDASAPDSAARLHQGGPKAGIVGKTGMGCEVWSRRARGESARALRGAEALPLAADQIGTAHQGIAIDDDFNFVAVEDASNWPIRKG